MSFVEANIDSGKRKRANVQVHITSGTGVILINNKKMEDYIQYNPTFAQTIKSPLSLLNIEEKYDVIIDANGGGIKGQVDAIKLAISKIVYSLSNSDNKLLLKQESLLTCNSKRKERRKYGLKKARKSPQFSKR